MAFMNRGENPFEKNNSNDNKIGNKETQFLRRYSMFRIYTYVPLDNTYVLIQMIMTFIILIIGAIAFFTLYDSPIADPIKNIKSTYINTYLIIIAILACVDILINYIAKDGKSLYRKLIVLLSLTVINLLVFTVIKINFDNKYNEEKFEQFYEEQISEKIRDDNDKNVFIGLTGISMKTQKEYYISECINLYGTFTIKTIIMMIMNMLLCFLLIFQLIKVLKIDSRKQQLNQDDLIMFDDEENVKY